ncbi:DUF2268 domain-containing putative Zn-dependent protease [Aquimarina sp. 2201CG14-23]|uniref:DUF2268 domain-containing putative Zn-dependent protease n=1 Tax=Aquimarina mycalae TaxID=3040073 RepID=UPI00247812C6|nr:DUF2268 domain-containing putative Zn-dependent protease [Aquimarina sp. 2201CG14-23]MDH7447489.1 DUF2268 domain-containing putative Zn-dependent protease [Aquimarina sp. 2201CG14-23]
MKNHIIYTYITLLICSSVIAQEKNHKVVFMEEYFNEYITAAKANNENLKDLYLEKVRTPIFNKFFMKSEYAPFVYEDLARPSLDISYLQKTLEGITSNKKQIEKKILKALEKSNKLLKNDGITVYVLPPSSELQMMSEDMNGVFGFTAGSKQILINIDTTVNGWEETLSYAIAHEYNHTYWTKENLAGITKWTLLDYLVFEGRGDYFAKLLYPKVETKWTEALTKEKKQALWKNLQPHLDSQDFAFQAEVIFGSDRFPMWGGYSLGYDIVHSGLSKDTSIKPELWINYSSEKILGSSHYHNE